MVDPVNLFLRKNAFQHAVQFLRRLQAAAERLFHDDALGAAAAAALLDEVVGAELLDDLGKIRGRRGQVEQPVARRAVLAVDLLQEPAEFIEPGAVTELGLMIVNPPRQRVPNGGIEGTEPGELLRSLQQFGAKFLVGLRPARETDDDEGRRQLPFVGQVVQRGQKFAVREVACRAKDHQRARLRCPLAGQSLPKRIVRECGFVHDP